MENFQKPNPIPNVALAQASQNQKPQEQKAIETKDKKPLSKNAQLVQELKKILTKLSSIERREKTAQNAIEKAQKELAAIAAEKAQYEAIAKKFDVVAV
ncbi:hypothetical protein [uncultured Campylobacter sp.]|uniref:hypothetical protein n=1 Tax=uncultured Campylobacter sp. TaxID=218934 RepID=UPI00262FE0BA|nr:hypothetical protein [uncultured Campylobacter sp.]